MFTRMRAITIIAHAFLYDATTLTRSIRLSIMIALGSMALTIIMVEGLITGMHQATVSQLTRLYGNLMITPAPDQDLSLPVLRDWLASHGYSQPHTRIAQRYEGHGLVSTHHATSSLSTCYYLMSSDDPLMDGVSTPLLGNLPSDAPLAISLGIRLAHHLRAQVGDTVDLHYFLTRDVAPHISNTQGLPIQKQTGIVIHILSTGIDEIDQQGIIIHHHPRQAIPEYTPITYIYLQTTDAIPLHKLLQQALGSRASVYQWADLFPGLAAGMALERYATRMVLALIWFIILVTFSALALLLLVRKQRILVFLRIHHTPGIVIAGALMYALGSISCLSICIGSFTAYILAGIITRYQLIALPNCYYQSYVSIIPSGWAWCILVISLLSLLCLFILVYVRYLYRQPLHTLMAHEGL